MTRSLPWQRYIGRRLAQALLMAQANPVVIKRDPAMQRAICRMLIMALLAAAEVPLMGCIIAPAWYPGHGPGWHEGGWR